MIIRPTVSSILLALAAWPAACGAISLAQALDFPNQTVKVVVPFTPGGGVDVVARIVMPRFGESLGQPVIIENRGGAGGMLGAAAVVQSLPDGYTLLLGTGSTHGTNSSTYARPTYDPVRDFAPVAPVSASPLLLVTAPSIPARSVGEFIALAQARPRQFSFGSYGTGSINHLAAELLNLMAGIEATHVPYRGSAPALTDLIADRIQYTLDGVATSTPFVQAGKITLLGVSGPRRSLLLPDAPTIAEAGVPGFDVTVWTGLFAPAHTPPPIIALLNSKMVATLAIPEVRDGLKKVGIEVTPGSAADLALRVQSEMQKWTNLVREKNIHIEQ